MVMSVDILCICFFFLWFDFMGYSNLISPDMVNKGLGYFCNKNYSCLCYQKIGSRWFVFFSN